MLANSIPFKIRLFRLFYKILALLWPAQGARLAFNIWVHSPRYPESRREQNWRKLALSEAINVAGKKIAVYRWGAVTPGYVFLLHGWSGRASQLGGFINSINHAGMGVIGFDAPGHGMSDGNSTYLYEIANAADDIIKKYGQPKAIVAHSYGGMVAAYMIRKYLLSTNRLVMISSPKKTLYQILAYQTYYQIPDKIMQRFHKLMYDKFGKDVYQDTSTNFNLLQLDIDLLIIHDKDDLIVGWEQARSLADELVRHDKSVETFYTNKLGHQMILRDKEVINKAIEFIKQRKS